MALKETRRAAAQEIGAALSMTALAEAAVTVAAPELRAGLLAALTARPAAADWDAAWAVWGRTRQPELLAALRASGHAAANPAELAVLSRLALAPDAPTGAETAAGLGALLAAALDPDPALAGAAHAHLVALEDAAAQEALCAWVIEHDHPAARRAALAAGFAPEAPQRRALFFLLTEQWERWEALDFDAALLQAVFETGGPELRARLAALARQAGWRAYLDLTTQRRRLEALSPAEWEVVRTLLQRQERAEDLWRLAQEAPPRQSARLLAALGDLAWRPADPGEAAGLEALLGAAARLAAAPPDYAAAIQATLRGPTRLVTALAFAPTGEWLAAGSADRRLHLWPIPSDPETVPPEAYRLEGLDGRPLALAFAPDGATLASGGAERAVRLWRLGAGAPQAGALLGGHTGAVAGLAFAPGGGWLASGDAVTLRVWHVEAEGAAARLAQQIPPRAGLRAVASAPAADGTVWLLHGDDHTLTLVTTDAAGVPQGAERVLMETVAQAALPPDSTRLATVSPYGRARLWRLPEGDLLATYDGRVDGRSLAVSAAHLAAGDRDGVHLWRLEATGASAAPPLELPGTALALAFSPDGRLLAVGRDGGGLDVWLLPGATGDAPQPVLTEAELGGPAALLAFAPDGARLAVAAGERIQLYRLIRLATLWDTPLAKLTVAQLAAAQADLPATAAGDHGRAWVDFSAALLGWRGRFDIALGEPGNVRLGEFDIALGPEAA